MHLLIFIPSIRFLWMNIPIPPELFFALTCLIFRSCYIRKLRIWNKRYPVPVIDSVKNVSLWNINSTNFDKRLLPSTPVQSQIKCARRTGKSIFLKSMSLFFLHLPGGNVFTVARYRWICHVKSNSTKWEDLTLCFSQIVIFACLDNV